MVSFECHISFLFRSIHERELLSKWIIIIVRMILIIIIIDRPSFRLEHNDLNNFLNYYYLTKRAITILNSFKHNSLNAIGQQILIVHQKLLIFLTFLNSCSVSRMNCSYEFEREQKCETANVESNNTNRIDNVICKWIIWITLTFIVKLK